MQDFVVDLETVCSSELLNFAGYEFDMPEHWGGIHILLKELVLEDEISVEKLPRLLSMSLWDIKTN
jgi:hypothetical protein